MNRIPGAIDGTDPNAIHSNSAGELADVAAKGTPIAADILLIEDSADSNTKKRITVGSLPTGGGGEANTASNVGTGVEVFKQKAGVDLEFKSINAASAKVVVSTVGDEVDVDVADASATQAGAIEIATQGEVDTGTDTTRAIVPDTLAGSMLATNVTANTAKVTNANHTGDVTGDALLTIAADAVTNAKLADVATATFKGRITAAPGDPEDLTGTEATTLLDPFTSTLQGVAPASTGLTTDFLRADGTWIAPPGGGTDELVGVSANDTTPGYLLDKLTTATTGVAWTELNDGGDEDLRLDVDSTSTSGPGLIELATQAEINAGTDTTRAVTAATDASSTLNARRALLWAFSATTTDSDPGAATFRLNNATQGSATFVYVDDTAAPAADLGTIIGALAANDRLWVQQSNDQTRHHLFRVTGAPTDGTDYWKIPVVSEAVGADLQAAAECVFTFFAVGTRPPADHASSHTDGSDDIQDATAAQKGLATAAQITKLDAIEPLADVTDATNVNAAGAIMESDYNAQTVLVAVSDDTPVVTTVGDSEFVGRPSGGDVGAMTATQARTVLNVEDGAVALPVADTTEIAKGSADATKRVRLEVDGLTTGTTRVITMPDKDVTIDDDGDARPPTAHASSHTNGTDDIQSATAAQKGVATAAQITKLDGIEALADVTDAANVAAAGAVMETLADAKGDLFAASAADTVARLAVGADGNVLTADSLEPTGVKWVAAGGGTPAAHAASHQDGGTDEIATATPGAAAIPKADGSSTLDAWISPASPTVAGIMETAIVSEVNTGTDDARAVSPLSLAGSALASDVTTNNAKVTNANHTGDVMGATALTVAPNAVTNAKLAQMPTITIKGNNTGVLADPLDLTGAEFTAIMDLFNSGNRGTVPGSGGGMVNFLRADGSWAVPPGGGGGGGWSVATVAAATRTAADGEFILVNVATCTITLPAPVADARVAVKVIFATVTDIQIKTSGADIDGTDHSVVGLELKKQFEQVSVVSDGTDWWIY